MVRFWHGKLCVKGLFMKIQAINPVHSCQPIKQVEFGKKAKKINLNEAIKNSPDTFQANQISTEQKYDLACRLAAYYKTQYENLLKTGVCEA